ncbi:MAG: SIMPL domain-containing protein, partial [Alphaproteobacteria bacterium]|nr:SIMPL domain-containing protein [Alphaproteobacteria bacterium]
IDALVAAGANQMNGVSFSIRDPARLLDEARAAAVDDAMRRASVLARAAHVTLGPIVEISEGNGFQPRPVFQTFAKMAAAPAPTPVATGEEELSANVAITWQIQ